MLIKGFNDDEIVDFIRFTENRKISVRFIEFMPFDGNRWNKNKLVTQSEILKIAQSYYKGEQILRLPNEVNYTSRDYNIKNYKGNFGIISSVSNPFCDSCNRIRLTANGTIKNCLFSNIETNLLASFRAGKSIEPLIQKLLFQKKAVRAGMDSAEKLEDPKKHTNNRSMITIGG